MTDMPRPDARLHATHDPELVAAYAAGDATGPQLAAAEALVASCTECATLHRDLRAIMAALPAMSAPVRPRDFRLTPEVAASLRPSRFRRLLAPFASARFAFAGPAGIGLAALGLAGILLSGGLGIPALPGLGGAASTATSEKAPELAPAASQPLDMASGSVPYSNASGGGTIGGAAVPDASVAASDVAVLAPSSAPSTNTKRAETPAPVPTPGANISSGSASTGSPNEPSSSPLPLISAVAVALGVLLVVLRLVARRAARAG